MLETDGTPGRPTPLILDAQTLSDLAHAVSRLGLTKLGGRARSKAARAVIRDWGERNGAPKLGQQLVPGTGRIALSDGARVRKARVARSLSQGALAASLDVGRGHVALVEQERRVLDGRLLAWVEEQEKGR